MSNKSSSATGYIMEAQKVQSGGEGMAAAIAEQLREAISSGALAAEERLPVEEELAERFGVSRPTIREALKRLAAQNLIRSRRGPTGGTFVNRISWTDAHDSLAMLSTLVVGMQGADPGQVIEARLVLLKACVPFAVQRRSEAHLDVMRAEIAVQRNSDTSDEDFCASDVRFHRALADATDNPVLAFQLAGVVEGMQPLLNVITYQARDRELIAGGHEELVAALVARDAPVAKSVLTRLAAYMSGLTAGLLTRRGT